MRQAGILAAAARFALAHHVGRLDEDHARARRLAEALAEHPAFRLDPGAVRTNIVIAEIVPPNTVDAVLDVLRRQGVLAGSMGPGRARFVTHLDVDDAGLERTLAALRAL
jgi:threonine aldolase